MTDKIATMLHEFHTAHTANYADIILDLCPYSCSLFTLYSRIVTAVLLCLTKNAVLSLLVVNCC